MATVDSSAFANVRLRSRHRPLINSKLSFKVTTKAGAIQYALKRCAILCLRK